MQTLCDELCRVFLGWRLGEDREALLALGEGALRIDLLSGECWYDEEPLPALFIAGELMRTLERVRSEREEPLASAPLRSARLDAFFATRAGSRRALDIAVRVSLSDASGDWSAETRNDPGGEHREAR